MKRVTAPVWLLAVAIAGVVAAGVAGMVASRHDTSRELAEARAEVAKARDALANAQPRAVKLAPELWLFTDPGTGCQYLKPTGNSSLTPRLPTPCPPAKAAP